MTAIDATAAPASTPDQQRQRGAQDNGAPSLPTSMMTPTRQAHAPRNGYNSLADLKARRQQQDAVTATPDRPHASNCTQLDKPENVPHPIDISDILVWLCMASGDERQLQLIYDTITVQAAAPVWTLEKASSITTAASTFRTPHRYFRTS